MKGENVFAWPCVLMICFLLFVIAFGGNGCGKGENRVDNYKTEKVVSVGGCNKYGECSYLTDKGSVGVSDKPVVGGTVEINKFTCEKK